MHGIWKRIVLESYPKYEVSPERDITGLGAIVGRRAEKLKHLTRSLYQGHNRVLKRHGRTFRKLAAADQARPAA